MSLTEKHIRVRDFILEYQRTHGRKPLWKEIMGELGIGSRRTLSKYMRRLEKDGALKLEYTVPQAKEAEA
jgi:SOS-response transcriptional repressor LexA